MYNKIKGEKLENPEKFSPKDKKLFGLAMVFLVLCFITLINFSSEPLELVYLIASFIISSFLVSLGVITGFFKYESPKYTKGIFVLLGCFAFSLTILYLFFFNMEKEILLKIATGFSLLGNFWYFLKVRAGLIIELDELKRISLRELKKMVGEKKVYRHLGLQAKSEDNFDRALYIQDVSYLKNMGSGHYIISNSKETYIKSVKIVGGDCVESTPLSQFKQGQTYKLLAADPYEISEGTPQGIYKSKYSKFLVLETPGGLLLCVVIDSWVMFLQILKSA